MAVCDIKSYMIPRTNTKELLQSTLQFNKRSLKLFNLALRPQFDKAIYWLIIICGQFKLNRFQIFHFIANYSIDVYSSSSLVANNI